MGAWEATDPNTGDGSNADVTVTRYYSAGGVQLASKTTGGSTLVTLGDVQGSAQVTVDASGQVARNAYTPYGVKRAGSNVASAHGWLNQIADADTGLTYLNARYYDPALGRFLSPDPLLNPGDPRTLDPYRYADNNPVVYLDATGLSPCDSMMSFAMGLLGHGCGGNHQTANNAGQVTGGFAEGSRGYVDDTKRALSADGAKAVISDVSKYGAGAPTAWAVEGFADNAMHVGMASQSLVAYQMYRDSRSLRQAGYYSAQPIIDGTIAYNSALLAGMGATGMGGASASIRGLARSVEPPVAPARAASPSSALVRTGDYLNSVHDVMANPQLLAGKHPGFVHGLLKDSSGWQVGVLGKGSHKGTGWVLREYGVQGQPTGRQIRWHPGGGHPGPEPYWRVVGANGGVGGIIR